jgi:hypothetical protein
MWKKVVIIAIALVVLVSTASVAQCAMCRASVGSNLSEGRGVIGTGINFGILYLLSAPYLLVAGLFIVWYRTGKKELAKKLSLSRKMKDIYAAK